MWTQDTRMAISPQRVIQYTSCLILGYGFQGRRIEWRYFRLHQIQVGGRPPSWIISNGHISATAHSIHLYSAHRAVIFVIAQLSSMMSTSLLFLRFIHCLQLLGYWQQYKFCRISKVKYKYSTIWVNFILSLIKVFNSYHTRIARPLV